jgi:hypothetical protein
LWNPKTGKQRIDSPLIGLNIPPLTGVAFNREGSILGASALNGRIFLWDVERWEPIGSPGLRGDREALSIAFSPKDKMVASGSSQSALFFDIGKETWRAEACAIVGRNMTREEWRKYLRPEPYRSTCPENEKGEALGSRLAGALKN